MFKIYAKIGMIQATVPLEIVAYIFMTGPMSKQVGNLRKILKNRKDKDGKESITQILPKNKIAINYLKLLKNINLLNPVLLARKNTTKQLKLNADIFSALHVPSKC